MLIKTQQSYLVLFLICALICSCKRENTSNIQTNKQDNTIVNNSINDLVFDYLPAKNANQIIRHEFYTLSYNEKYEQAEWVAYQLKSDMISNNHFERPFFIEDKLVTTRSADWRNYKNSGYDKGHLCPAGDMKFSKKSFDDTFFTSNISPQKHDFNDGVWNRLEGKVRYWAQKYNSIYVVTGGVLKNGLPEIGRENVAVPQAFYKVLLKNDGGNYKMIAFLVPSEDSSKPLYEFVISVDELENITGIDFYPNLSDSIENILEKSNDYKDWSF